MSMMENFTTANIGPKDTPLTMGRLEKSFGPQARERLRVEAIIKKINYRDWKISLRLPPSMDWHFLTSLDGPCTLVITHEVKDSDTGERITLSALTPFQLMEEAPDEAYVHQIRAAIHKRELHEADEFFIFDGKRPYHPHRMAAQ